MADPVVFYAKCRPQEADAWPIADRYRIVFVGYPPWRDYESYKNAKVGFRRALYDIVNEPHCADAFKGGYKRAVSWNANLAASVSPGSFVIVPRPEHGVCHVGDIRDTLHIVDEPVWADAYLKLRYDQGLPIEPVGAHVADVVQCWNVNAWTEHSFARMPRWIVYRLLSRNTSGIIHDFPDMGLNAYKTVAALRSDAPPDAVPGKDAMSVSRRLVELVGPSAFEHLVVHLLQLEDGTRVFWHHVGGSGDGGVDGIGVASNSDVVGVLQCKWRHGGDLRELVTQALKVRDRWPKSRVVIAVLLGPTSRPDNLPEGVTVLLRDDTAALIEKHRRRLPLAMSLGVTGAGG